MRLSEPQMHATGSTRCRMAAIALVLLCFFVGFAAEALAARDYPAGMTPGDCYREYTVHMADAPNGWRVTDPNSIFERAADFLPNPILKIEGVDLEQAVRAELTIDFWSGHNGTRGKKLRFNDKKQWISLVEDLKGAMVASEQYMAQYNLTVPVPLTDLVDGINTLRGTCGDNNWGWGQWGWYSATLRVYLDPESTPISLQAVEGSDSADTLEFELVGDGLDAISSVDVLARYEGVDENGDGESFDYHGMYRRSRLRNPVAGASTSIKT